MGQHIYRKPKEVSFSRGGADGYSFPLESKRIEIDFIDSKTGHGGRVVSNTVTHFYYVLEGKGEFEINGKIYPVSDGEIVEIPPKHIFDYTGKMRMILVMEPPFSAGEVSEVK